MDLRKEDKLYLINTKIKLVQIKINSIGTEEDFGISEEDLYRQLEALTNASKMI